MKPIETSVEVHPEWYFPIRKMQCLILGTFPPHKDRWDFEFYFPNKVNHFWKVMAKVAGRQLQHFSGAAAVRERQNVMQALGAGVHDTARVIERQGKSALDNDIRILEHQNIPQILLDNPSIKTILLTGYSGRTNAYASFLKCMRKHKIPYTTPRRKKAAAEFSIEFERSITCIIGNSTSPTAQKAGVVFEDLLKQFERAINKPA